MLLRGGNIYQPICQVFLGKIVIKKQRIFHLCFSKYNIFKSQGAYLNDIGTDLVVFSFLSDAFFMI